MKETWAIIEWLVQNSLYISIFLISLFSLSRMREIVMLRRGCQPRTSPPRWRVFLGLTLGILGISLTLVGFFMPIYMVDAEIQITSPVDQREAELIVLDGWNGVQTNISPIGKSPIISSLRNFMRMLLIASIWFMILDILGMKSSKHIGDKQVRGGLFLLAFLITIIVFISRVNWIIEFLSGEVRGGLAPVAAEVIQRIASQPLHGAQMITTPVLNIYISWGIGPGYFVILAAAIIKIAGGLILKTRNPSS